MSGKKHIILSIRNNWGMYDLQMRSKISTNFLHL